MTALRSPDEFRRHVAGGDLPHVVAAVGTERFLQDEVVKIVATRVLGDVSSPHLVTVQGGSGSVDAEREALARFFSEARTASLFAPAKVVVLRNADGQASRHKAAFEEWLSGPPSAVHAIIVIEALPKPIEKLVRSRGATVQCGSAWGRQRGESAAKFVMRWAHAREKHIGHAEAQQLVDLVGTQFSALDNAVEMLALHAGDSSRITGVHIDALLKSGREGSVWAFGDLLVQGDTAAAMAEGSRCFMEGVPEYTGSRKVTRAEPAITVRLLSAFTRAAMRTLRVRRQLDEGVPQGQLDWGPGRQPPRGAQFEAVRVARRRRRPVLESLVVFAEDTERGVKSGGAGGRVAISRLVTRVGMLP